jgi:protease I
MKALFIIAQEGFQEHEYNKPKEILEEAGIEVITASKKAGLCTSPTGSTTEAQISLQEVNVKDYLILLFVGGPGARVYQLDKEAHRLAQEAIVQNKILAAICIAPTILAYAGVLAKKRATVWNSDNKQAFLLQQYGATYSNKPVLVDGNIITANGPPAAEQFAMEILELVKKKISI